MLGDPKYYFAVVQCTSTGKLDDDVPHAHRPIAPLPHMQVTNH